jgi:hypothetical protein
MIRTMLMLRDHLRRHALTPLAIAVAMGASAGLSGIALAQTVAPQPGGSPMVKPPAAASQAASATNPDNMPVKKPRKSTHDDMIRGLPASATTAK